MIFRELSVQGDVGWARQWSLATGVHSARFGGAKARLTRRTDYEFESNCRRNCDAGSGNRRVRSNRADDSLDNDAIGRGHTVYDDAFDACTVGNRHAIHDDTFCDRAIEHDRSRWHGSRLVFTSAG